MTDILDPVFPNRYSRLDQQIDALNGPTDQRTNGPNNKPTDTGTLWSLLSLDRDHSIAALPKILSVSGFT